MIYRKRRNLFDPAESEWRAEDDALVARDARGVETRFFWRDLTGLRLAFAPSRRKRWRHVFVLTFRGRRKVEIDNGHFAGFADFEDRSASYVPFVRAALDKIGRARPDLPVELGARPLAYLLNTLFVIAAFAFLALAILLVPLPLGVWPATAIARLVVIALLFPAFLRWLKRARPRGTALDAIPPDALPTVRERG
jgi:hypothetical protein